MFSVVISGALIIVEDGLLDFACILVDPDVIFPAVFDGRELVVGSAPVRVNVSDEVAHRPNFAGALGRVGFG